MYTTRIFVVKIRVENSKQCEQLRIFAVKTRGANSKLYTTRIFAENAELQILTCTQLGLLPPKPYLQILKYTTQIFAVKIRIANFETKQPRFSN